MTIAYGIALWMNWDNPFWAGFTVAFVSLATIGQSLNKAGLRLLGSAAGILVAFIIIAQQAINKTVKVASKHHINPAHSAKTQDSCLCFFEGPFISAERGTGSF